MRTITEAEFLRWAASKGLHLDPKYPDAAVLDFEAGSDSRFWSIPAAPEHRPYFLASLLELMGDWQACYAWRHLGGWPNPVDAARQDLNAAVEVRILEGLGVPLGTADVLVLDRSEFDRLVTLLFTTTVFGWSVDEDLYVVPDHAHQVLQTDHHGVVHVSFGDSNDVDRWVSEMATREFALPDELPDATFKRPPWMPE